MDSLHGDGVGYTVSPWIVQGLSLFGVWIPFTVMGLVSLFATLTGFYLDETATSVKRTSDERVEDVHKNNGFEKEMEEYKTVTYT